MGPCSPEGKSQIETPASGFDNNFPNLEIPLDEEPIPEQKSMKQSVIQAKQFEHIRASNDYQFGLQEEPRQPNAHDEPPPGYSGTDASPIKVKGGLEGGII